MPKALIAYGTRYGATAEVAAKIAAILEKKFDLSVDVVDLYQHKVRDLSGYDSIILGSGIKMGKWTGRAKRFLKLDLSGKKLAVFVCSGRAGESGSYRAALEKYVIQFLAKNSQLRPAAQEAFGGRKPLKNNQFHDNRDWEKIRSWAEEVGRLFTIE